MANTRETALVGKKQPAKGAPKPMLESAAPTIDAEDDHGAVDHGKTTALEPVIDEGHGDNHDDHDDHDDHGGGADGDGEIVDVGGPGLVRATRVSLPGDPGGDWVKEDISEPSDDELQKTVKDVGGGRDDIYKTFVRQATRVQRLTEEEERAFGLRVRDHGDVSAQKKLVVHNLRLVIKMGHQYRRSWTNVMDLIQEASAGMAIAAQRWDPDQGTRFGTYAVYWMRAQLTKFLMTNGRAIHTGNTRAGRKLYFQLPRVRRKLLAEGKDASV